MYEWHKAHPEKGKRFGMAMQGVTQSESGLDGILAVSNLIDC